MAKPAEVGSVVATYYWGALRIHMVQGQYSSVYELQDKDGEVAGRIGAVNGDCPSRADVGCQLEKWGWTLE